MEALHDHANSDGARDCRTCTAWKQCFTDSADAHCIDKVCKLVRLRGPVERGEALYHHGDEFTHLYVVQSGVVKTESESLDGRLNVTGFYTCGDMFGLEGIGSKHLPGRAVVVRDAVVCELSYTGLLALCERNPVLNQGLIARLGRRLQEEEYRWKAVRSEPGYARVLAFFADLKRRQELAGNTEQVIDLPMSKHDIASFLGLSPESLSRALRKLEDDGLVKRISVSSVELIAPPPAIGC